MADAKLVTLTSPIGSQVSVSEEKAERLLRQGYTKPEAKTSTRKSSSSK